MLRVTWERPSQRYDRDVLVAETAYPFTLGDEDGYFNIIGEPEGDALDADAAITARGFCAEAAESR